MNEKIPFSLEIITDWCCCSRHHCRWKSNCRFEGSAQCMIFDFLCISLTHSHNERDQLGFVLIRKPHLNCAFWICLCMSIECALCQTGVQRFYLRRISILPMIELVWLKEYLKCLSDPDTKRSICEINNHTQHPVHPASYTGTGSHSKHRMTHTHTNTHSFANSQLIAVN